MSDRYSYHLTRSPGSDSVKSYDHMLHQSLDKIFRESCLSSNQIKELLHSQKSTIRPPILEQEPILSRQFSKEVLEKLSLLWIAVLAGYQKSAELLVRSGADVNELFGSHLVCHTFRRQIDEKLSILHLLLQMDPSPENERLIRLVTEHGADLEARDHSEQTILHTAVRKDRVQITEMLLEKGADVNAADNDGVTPLLAAAKGKKVKELLPLLIKHGADIFAKDNEGRNALHCLAQLSPDEERAIAEHVKLSRILIEKGVSLVEKDNSHNYQPIHLAAKNAKNELVKLYLNKGANVNAITKDGRSPLHIVTAEYYSQPAGDKTVTQTLLKRGAKIDLRTTEGRTALHVACEMTVSCRWMYYYDGWGSFIRLLLSAGADLLSEDLDGETPFSLILFSGDANEPGISLSLRLLVLKSICQPSIELTDEMIIEAIGDPLILNYCRGCIEQIDRMKCTRFIETCTVFELLTKSQCQIAALMQNPEFEPKFRAFEFDGLNGFFHYAKVIRIAFERAQDHYHSLLKQENKINEAVYNILPYVVVKKVVRYIFNDCYCSKNGK